MTTPEMVRCKHCSYLVEDEDGNWVCEDCGLEIHEIEDEDCSAEQEW
jgi:DNA-directed RNA polymerase subunit RPC12/RpoP